MRILTPLLLLLALTASCTPQTGDAMVSEISTAEMIVLPNDASTAGGLKFERIVALGNGTAEILVAMGLGSLVVGRDIASDISELSEVPVVTNGHEVSAEKVLQVDPDLVIVDSNSSPRSAIAQLERVGIRIVRVPESYGLGGIKEKVDAVAAALGDSSRGDLLNKEIADAIGRIDDAQGEDLDVLFLYLRGSNGIFLVGGKGSGADALITAAGAQDVGATLYKNPFTPINSEAILDLKPDRYLLMSAGLASVGGIEAFRRLPGIDSSVPVITVDDSLLLSFGPRTPDLIRRLSEALYDAS